MAGALLTKGGQYALLGTTATPGFEYDDYGISSEAELEMLVSQFPDKEELLRKLMLWAGLRGANI